jgi:glycosyltransferase involved in cell wall biosynthesis
MSSKLLIVMPVYNSEKTLKGAISSILRQTYKDFNLIVVDDCSTDDSFEIAKGFEADPRVKVYQNPKNMGAYYSRNYGLYMAKDSEWDYFTTHDADDKSKPNRYTTLISRLEKSDEYLGIQDIFDRVDLKTKKLISSKLTIAHAVFKREVFDAIGYFDLVRFGGDWEHWERLKTYCNKTNKSTIHISQSLGISYMHDSNLTILVPENSKPRSQYIKESVEKIKELDKKNKLKYSFSPSAKTRIKDYSKMDSKNGAKPKVTVVLLTWQRVSRLKYTLKDLAGQTYKDFDIRISNANLKYSKVVDKYASFYSKDLDIKVSHDGNKLYAFRRFTVGRELAKAGTEIVLFIDDDISFPSNYIELALSQYEPKSYKSEFAWQFFNGGRNYYKYRTKVRQTGKQVHYCGTGVGMIDASIFLDDGLLKPPEHLWQGALKVEDLWLSYYASHILDWKLEYMEIPDVTIGGADNVALYKSVLSDPYTKADFLVDLVKTGWRIKG